MSVLPNEHPTTQYVLQVGAKGRLVLPALLRKQLDLQQGDRVLLTVEPDGNLRLTSLKAQVKRLRGILKRPIEGEPPVEVVIQNSHNSGL
jgi:AbrB family looped-hinge helix DNA binding protein